MVQLTEYVREAKQPGTLVVTVKTVGSGVTSSYGGSMPSAVKDKTPLVAEVMVPVIVSRCGPASKSAASLQDAHPQRQLIEHNAQA